MPARSAGLFVGIGIVCVKPPLYPSVSKSGSAVVSSAAHAPSGAGFRVLDGHKKLPPPGKLVKHANLPPVAIFETNRLLVMVNDGGGLEELPGKSTGKCGA